MSASIIPVIAIDGPSGSGKGTIASLLARHLGWSLLDSGAIYRLVALAAEYHQIPLDQEAKLSELAAGLDVRFIPATEQSPANILLEGQSVTDCIRTEQVGAGASKVAALPQVRAALLQRQRDFRQTPGLIADGRDMGTVVFPDAPLKIFLTASAEERARRRYLQLKDKSPDVTLTSLLGEINARDARDTQRAIAPLVAAPDALSLDSTSLSIDQVLKYILDAAIQRNLCAERQV
ncbi:cytidylate kinase [Azomonas agilis]|uniref:Cytidylate kinase n=1 Tax=Azomonas agilis TaxID=116849 RepID=A0A562I1P6_9GAMM|nr:(d)CMP kinase [Azomonas agilis]TWH64969.1 cytidylate kinase [Azomonas agilis]